jgi:3' exoribonuclease, RNase T-like
MRLFLDTEYTGYGHSDPSLISLALVAEDGQREFYVELSDTWDVSQCSTFVERYVLPLLDGHKLSLIDARSSLRFWLDKSPRNLQIACDSQRDFVLFKVLLGLPWIKKVNTDFLDLRPLIDTPVYDNAVNSYYLKDPRRHHALVDARAYRRGWLAWQDRRKNIIRSRCSY